jgi:hypothetical protein
MIERDGGKRYNTTMYNEEVLEKLGQRTDNIVENDICKPKSKAITTTHPDQPLIINEYGVTVFKKNRIVEFLLTHSSLNINELILDFEFSIEDWAQFWQLLGRSWQFFIDEDGLPDKIKDRISQVTTDSRVDEDLIKRYGRIDD